VVEEERNEEEKNEEVVEEKEEPVVTEGLGKNDPPAVLTVDDIQIDIDAMIEKAIKTASSLKRGQPIRIDCELPGHEGEYILFQSAGWRFKDMKAFEEALGATATAGVVCKKIISWKLTVDGAPVFFEPAVIIKEMESLPAAKGTGEMQMKELERKLERSYYDALDELTPELATWVWSSYRLAYQLSGSLSPN
jgi:hypothetical protein